MAKRPIITIDVDDSHFKAFLELFQKYQDEVANLPGKWNQLDHAVTSTGSQFNQMTALLMTQTQLINQALQAHDKLRTTVTQAGDGMKRLSDQTKSVATYLIEATKTLAKWTVAGGLIGGLLGLGGLWGLERLAGSASQARRSAGGLGVTSGEEQAFETNYNRFFDPTGVLSNIAESKADYTRRWNFYQLGFTPDQVEREDPAQLAAEMAPRAKKLWQGSDHSSQAAHYLGLDNFFTLEDLRRLEKTPDDELEAARKRYDTDKGGMAVPDKTQRAWQDFSDQLDRAGTHIKNAFITGLVPLEPGLVKLSDALVHLIDAVLRNPHMDKWIDDLGQGLDHLATEIDSPDFNQNIDHFMENLEHLAIITGRIAIKMGGWLDWLLGDPDTPRPRDEKGVPYFGPGSSIGPDGKPLPEPAPPSTYNEGVVAEPGTLDDTLTTIRNWFTNNPSRNRYVAETELSKTWSIDQESGILGMLRAENAGLDPNMHNPAGGGRGAWGIAQWRGDRLDDFKSFAGYDMSDLNVTRDKRMLDQIRFLNYELTQGKEKATGDAIRGMRDAGDVADYGVRHYERPEPTAVEAESSAARRNAYRFKNDTVNINIYNNTGGSAIVTTNQAANQ